MPRSLDDYPDFMPGQLRLLTGDGSRQFTESEVQQAARDGAQWALDALDRLDVEQTS